MPTERSPMIVAAAAWIAAVGSYLLESIAIDAVNSRGVHASERVNTVMLNTVPAFTFGALLVGVAALADSTASRTLRIFI